MKAPHRLLLFIAKLVSTDEVVIIGANRNSFRRGGGSAGSASLVNLIRSISDLHLNHMWSPRRSLMLISWGGGEMGQLGAQEFIEVCGTVPPLSGMR
jgi:hypothetical protein